MKRNPIEIGQNVITPDDYDITLEDIETFIEAYKNDHQYYLICSVFAYGFEMGARATANGKYKPYQIRKMKQIRIQRGDHQTKEGGYKKMNNQANDIFERYKALPKKQQDLFIEIMELAIDRPDLQKFCIEYKGPTKDLPAILRQMI